MASRANSSSGSETPLMQQYNELKAQAGRAMLLFRMGDFYELFGDDAIAASRILEITLTSRDKNKPDPLPMAGVPHHSAQGYIQRLLKAGQKVAIAEQIEDPAQAKGIVKREIVRIFTPAIQFDCEGAESRYLATAVPASLRATDGRDGWLIACLDASTGETRASTTLSGTELTEALAALPIAHFLRLGHQLPTEAIQELDRRSGVLSEDLPSNYLSREQGERLLATHYGTPRMDAFFSDPETARALGILIGYTLKSQRVERLGHLRPPRPLSEANHLVYGPRTPQHLDLFPTGDGSPTLFELINKTRSALGARTLRRWIQAPLRDPAEIRERQTAVTALGPAAADAIAVRTMGEKLGSLYDIERICARVDARLVNPRDTLALGMTLKAAAEARGALKTLLAAKTSSATLSQISQTLEAAAPELDALGDWITARQRADAPTISRDGGIFEKGTNRDLDRLIELNDNGQRWLVELEARERQATGIPSLKVRYNRVFGYYIEVTQAHAKSVPPHYQRKQTMVGAERFFTDELKKFEEEILTASSRQKALELQLFDDLVTRIAGLVPTLMESAAALAELDSLLSLARFLEEPGWTLPEIDSSEGLEIVAGRHPLVEASPVSRGSFVPNTVRLGTESRRCLLITGPNMGGKSTLMRQVALIVILGQIGAPVPAERAHWGTVNALYTRIGAHDAIARGQSTFMVEMTELAHILHHADPRSLLILDEIGRGTSTYDGMSVAWAALEWVCSKLHARSLFATHYHELTRLEGTLPALANAHLAVESGSAHDLRFLYELREGPTNESFGVHVARLAGLPGPVVERAWQVLADLESADERNVHGGGSPHRGLLDKRAVPQFAPDPQLSLFDMGAPKPATPPIPDAPQGLTREHPVLKKIEATDLNQLTPLEALNLLASLQEEARA